MISVVIPAHNEEALLPKCLDSLCHQTTTESFEVIVVDNNSTDATARVAESFRKQLDIRVIQEKEKGRGSARAAGFAYAKGDIILSTDADTVVPSTWIEDLLKQFDDPKIVAVAGKVNVEDLSWIRNHFFLLWQRVGEVAYRTIFGHWWLGGYSFAIRKDVYEKTGGFNKNLNALEDIDLSMKVRQYGKIVQAPTKVTFSARRYKQGFLKGGLSYIKTFQQYVYSGKNSAMLSDIR